MEPTEDSVQSGWGAGLPGGPSLTPRVPLLSKGELRPWGAGRALPDVTQVLSAPGAPWREHWTGEQTDRQGRGLLAPTRRGIRQTAHLEGDGLEGESGWVRQLSQ